MAGLLVAGVVAGVTIGVDKVKAKRAARKAAQSTSDPDHDAMEGSSYSSSPFHRSSKSKSKKRRSSISKSALASANTSRTSLDSMARSHGQHNPPEYHQHQHQQEDPADPPPYDAPPYEPVIPASQLDRQATSEEAESSRKANERALKEARDKRYKEMFSFKNGNFWGLVGVGLASTYGSGYSDQKQFRYWDDRDDEEVKPKPHRKGEFDVI